MKYYIKHERLYLTTFPNTEEFAENTTRSGVYLTSLEVWTNTILSIWYIFSIVTKTKEKVEKLNRKNLFISSV